MSKAIIEVARNPWKPALDGKGLHIALQEVAAAITRQRTAQSVHGQGWFGDPLAISIFGPNGELPIYTPVAAINIGDCKSRVKSARLHAQLHARTGKPLARLKLIELSSQELELTSGASGAAPGIIVGIDGPGELYGTGFAETIARQCSDIITSALQGA